MRHTLASLCRSTSVSRRPSTSTPSSRSRKPKDVAAGELALHHVGSDVIAFAAIGAAIHMRRENCQGSNRRHFDIICCDTTRGAQMSDDDLKAELERLKAEN